MDWRPEIPTCCWQIRLPKLERRTYWESSWYRKSSCSSRLLIPTICTDTVNGPRSNIEFLTRWSYLRKQESYWVDQILESTHRSCSWWMASLHDIRNLCRWWCPLTCMGCRLMEYVANSLIILGWFWLGSWRLQILWWPRLHEHPIFS